MSWKCLLAIAIFALWAVGLPGCGNSESQTPGSPVVIVFKHAKHPRAAFLTEIVQGFERENPGIRIREEILPSSTDEQHQFYVINLAAQASDVDVLDMDVIWVPEFARAGWLAELTDQLGETELAPLNSAAVSADWLGGKLYAVPWFVDAGVLYYRSDLLDKYGFQPPKTYEELLGISQVILAAENNPRLMGFLWQGKQYEGLVCVALEFIRGNGGNLFDPDGHLSLTEPATLDALRFLQNLVWSHKVTPPLVTTLDEEASRHIFQSGRAIFMRNWPYAWDLLNLPESPVAGKVGLTSIPHFSGQTSAPTLGGFHLGINSHSRHRKEATAFVRYLIRRDVQKQVALKLGVLPANEEVYEDAAVRQALPVLSHILPSLRQVQPRPLTPYYPMISQILQPELSGVAAGLRSPRQAMGLAEQQIRHLLGLR
ncbi:MAG: ABC transporter substrate-binding protein [Acidobacteria bacterium]|nr:ABC transporter substrate-binding protein [Acidobacteriota bacterium]